jgi:nicotinate-nucleotide pyrophosphorylase (carboxylating)
MTTEFKKAAFTLISLAFDEDLGSRGDITSLALAVPDKTANAHIIAKQRGIVCGLDVLKMVFQHIDPSIQVVLKATDGDLVEPKQLLVELSGSSEKILIAERTALNFLGRLSGVATFTYQFVKEVGQLKTKLLDTRKTTPGWRLLEKYAVKCGGGENHRIGLYDMFLIKENHIAAAGGIAGAVRHCRDYMRSRNFHAEIEVETQNLQQVKEALALKVDRIMLDNMSTDELTECVQFVARRVPLEASGNVSLATVRRIAETGVDYISIGSLTHSAVSFDVSLLFES